MRIAARGEEGIAPVVEGLLAYRKGLRKDGRADDEDPSEGVNHHFLRFVQGRVGGMEGD